MTGSIVFIDGRVADSSSILSGLPADAQWFFIGSAEDGMARMQAVLANYSDLASVHIVSHGAAGSLLLGSTQLDAASLPQNSTALESMGQSLSEGGDILLYGCDIAQGEIGLQFLQSLAQHTQADVAASSDATGPQVLGGNAALEVATGTIEAAPLALDEITDLLASNTAPWFGFRGDGMVTTTIGSPTDPNLARSVVLQPDGKIVLAGYSYNGSNYDFALIRYLPDGRLDLGFADGGKLTTPIGSSDDYATSAVLQPDGKIVVAGYTYTGSNADFALARYNADGTLDTTFSGDGKLTAAFGFSLDVATSVALQHDGKIVVAGRSQIWDVELGYFGTLFSIGRFNADGTVDTLFSDTGSGKITTAIGSSDTEASSIALQPDGKIVVAGNSMNELALARYNTDGSLDTTFSGDGKLTTAIGLSFEAHFEAQSVVVQPDGKILVAGSSNTGSGYDFALVRYLADGSLDLNFSDDGMLTTAIGGDYDDATSVALQPDGKIVVAGYTATDNCDFALARYNADGSLDASFSGDGLLVTAIPGSSETAYSVKIQPDGKILVAGGSESSFAVFRYNADGSLDTTFDADPTVDAFVSYVENAAPIALDSSVVISDAELNAAGNYGGASITLARRGGVQAEDVFSSSLQALTEGGELSVAGTVVGTVTQASAGAVSITFNANATQVLVNQVLSSFQYRNISDAPPSSVQLEWSFSDGNAGTQGEGGAMAATTTTTTVFITAVNDSPTGTVTISGNATQGQTLTASNTLADADGLGTFSYQWQADGVDISGATSSTYILQQSEAGKAITVVASYTDGFGKVESVSSVATSAVANVNDLPTGGVIISGTAIQGQTLTATNTLADADGLGTISYQWVADGERISDAGSNTLTLSQALVGKTITVAASYTDGYGVQERVTSAATVAVASSVNSAPTFGIRDGRATTDIGTNSSDDGRSVTLLPDGKILVAGSSWNGIDGDFALVRYNTDGSLDTSFSGDGKVTTDIGSGIDVGSSVTVQTNGKILVAGFSINGSNYDLALVRYNSDGSLDTSFSGDGKVTTDIGTFSEDGGNSVTVQTDGKILVAGHSNNVGDPDLALVRYNTDGSLDTSFGGDGKVTADISTYSYDIANSITIQADGKILVAGSSHNGINDDFALARYNTDGSLDTSFSGDGKVITAIGGSFDRGYSVAVQTDGKILVAGLSSAMDSRYIDFALLRYNMDGSLDTSFGVGGIVTTDIGSNSDDTGWSVTVQSDGKILVAGGSWDHFSPTGRDFALVRYYPDGRLDASFGGDGKVTTDLGANGNEYGSSVTVQADGKILVAGVSGEDFALVRYNTDGSQDQTFGDLSTLDGVSSHIENGSAVILDNNVQILDPELSVLNSYGGATLTLARHGGASAQDLFSGAGIVAGQASGNVTASDTVIGTYAYANGALNLLFNSSATQSLVNQALQSLAYSNSSDAPPASVQIEWTFGDGNTGQQGAGESLTVAGSTTVNITAVNDVPTGSVTISGTATEGQTLTASHTLTDADGLGVISYQWRADGANISGATGSTYTLTAAEVGKVIAVLAQYSDGLGTVERVISAVTDAVTRYNTAPVLNAPQAASYTDTSVDDSFSVASGTLLASDAENDSLTFGIEGGVDGGSTVSLSGLYGALVVDKATGAWTYTPHDAAMEALDSDATERFTVTVSDGLASVGQPLDVNINATVDIPALTSKYFVLAGSGANHVDYQLRASPLSLQGQFISQAGTTGVDAIHVRPGSAIDFTASGASADKIYLDGAYGDYGVSLTGSVMTLYRGSGASRELVRVGKGASLVSSDVLVFADGAVSTWDLYNLLKSGTALPESGSETSLQPIGAAAPGSTLNATIKAFALDSGGETFASVGHGMQLIAVGGVGLDTVYVGDGSNVDATQLGASSDLIYLRGDWADYSKSLTGSVMTFSRSVNGQTETVKVIGGNGALNDKLVFADGAVLSNNAKLALIADLNAAIETVTGYDPDTTTPGLRPTLQASALDNVSNLDVSSDIVLNYSESVTAQAGKFIRIVDDGGAGFRGESSEHTQVIEVTDESQVSVVGGKVTLNPTFDLDLSSHYHIEIDAGAFVGQDSGQASEASDGSTSLNFSTVTPGTDSLANAATSQAMDDSGAMVAGHNWLEIEGIGSPSGNPNALDLAGGNYALVAKDYDPTGADSLIGYDGIALGDLNVALNNFAHGDLIYFDDQGNDAIARNDLGLSAVLDPGSAPTPIQFAGANNGLGGFIEISLLGSSASFDSISALNQLVGSTAVITA